MTDWAAQPGRRIDALGADTTSSRSMEQRAGFLLPGPPAMLAMPDLIVPITSLSGWLARLWQRLIHGDDAPVAESLTRLPGGVATDQAGRSRSARADRR